MIKTLVKDICEKYKTNCPLQIARNLGIDIVYLPFKKLKGILFVSNTKKIGINSSLPEPLQKVVLAHELGHYFLSPHGGYFYISEHTLFCYSREEVKANCFAAELLLQNEKPYHGETMNHFSIRMGVPLEIIKIWADYNKLI